MSKKIKNELQHILLGESEVSQGTLIQAAADYLRKSKKTISLAETDKHYKS